MSCCAIIVTFHPGAEIESNIAALCNQVDKIIVIDNGSDLPERELLEKLVRQFGIQIIYNPANLGIAAALNTGVKLAKAEGYDWIATFDQDSKVTPGMLATMRSIYNSIPEKDAVAGLSPRYRDPASGVIRGNERAEPVEEAGSLYHEVKVVMTSGNLVKASIFDVIGYFAEELFIDHVDNEFCLRCSARGYKMIEVDAAILEHCIGYPTWHRLLGKTYTTSNHSALRRYYIVRNSIHIYKKYFGSHRKWVLKNAYGLLRTIVMLILFETDRMRKMDMIFRGILDGLLGKVGKFEESV